MVSTIQGSELKEDTQNGLLTDWTNEFQVQVLRLSFPNLFIYSIE